jgi:hypothetical protein
MPVNIFACDLCGRTLRGGLAGFELFATCALCDGFDVCLDCCDPAAPTVAAASSSARKKKKKGKGAPAKGATKKPVGGPAVLAVAQHFDGQHAFTLVDRNRDEEDEEADQEGSRGCGEAEAAKESMLRPAGNSSLDDATAVAASWAAAEPPGATAATSTATALAFNKPATAASAAGGNVGARELLLRLAALASGGDATVPAFATGGRQLRWQALGPPAIPAAGPLAIPAAGPPAAAHAATAGAATGALATAAAAAERLNGAAGRHRNGSSAVIAARAAPPAAHDARQQAVAELEAALGAGLDAAAAALEAGAALVLGVRGSDPASHRLPAPGVGSDHATTPFWFAGTLALLRCALPVSAGAAGPAPPTHAGTTAAGPLSAAGGAAPGGARWAVLGAVTSAGPEGGGPWGSAGFGLLADALPGELGRTNRRWRRLRSKQPAEGLENWTVDQRVVAKQEYECIKSLETEP